jgi:hypothetical protein
VYLCLFTCQLYIKLRIYTYLLHDITGVSIKKESVHIEEMTSGRGKMDSHSKGNNDIPIGFLVQGEITTTNGLKIIRTPGIDIPEKTSTLQSIQIPRNYYLIAKAYSEPLGLDPVEEILLQRNFIID